MNRKEHLLDIAAEECAEVAQRCSKALRFGVDEIQPGQNLTNAERILEEFIDLCAVFEMLEAEGVLSISTTDHILEAKLDSKKKRVEQMLQYSRQQGTLTDLP